MIYSYNGELFSNKKLKYLLYMLQHEWTSKNYSTWKKPDIKYTLYDFSTYESKWFHSYEMSKIGKYIKTESRLVVSLD